MKRLTTSESNASPRSKKKVLQTVRAKEVRFGDLEWLCEVLNRLPDPLYVGPLSAGEETESYYNKQVKNERAAWEIAAEVLKPLGLIHRYALKRPQNFHAAYSGVAIRFTTTLGKHASGQLVVTQETKWPLNVDSPRWLRATVELPAWGEDNMNQVVAILVWKIIFQEEGYKKLRRCLSCSRWFLDHGRNQTAKFCENPSCANVWWSRGRRRRAKQVKRLLQNKGKGE